MWGVIRVGLLGTSHLLFLKMLFASLLAFATCMNVYYVCSACKLFSFPVVSIFLRRRRPAAYDLHAFPEFIIHFVIWVRFRDPCLSSRQQSKTPFDRLLQNESHVLRSTDSKISLSEEDQKDFSFLFSPLDQCAKKCPARSCIAKKVARIFLLSSLAFGLIGLALKNDFFLFNLCLFYGPTNLYFSSETVSTSASK